MFTCCGTRRPKSHERPSPAPQPQNAPPGGPREFINPNPFPNDAAFHAVKAHMATIARSHPERFRMVTRLGAFEAGKHWLEVNYPPPHIVQELGPCPVPIPLDYSKQIRDVRPGDRIIPISDTKVFMAMGVRGMVDGKADVGVVAMLMVVVPPLEEDGEGGVKMPVAGEFVDNGGVAAAEAAFLMFLRGAYELEQLQNGCQAVVAMGTDQGIFEFVPGEGMEEFPDGVDWVMKDVLGMSDEEVYEGRRKLKNKGQVE